jgi:hypothetical protein
MINSVLSKGSGEAGNPGQSREWPVFWNHVKVIAEKVFKICSWWKFYVGLTSRNAAAHYNLYPHVLVPTTARMSFF